MSRTKEEIIEEIERLKDEPARHALIMVDINGQDLADDFLLDGYFTLDEVIKLGELAKEYKELTK